MLMGSCPAGLCSGTIPIIYHRCWLWCGMVLQTPPYPKWPEAGGQGGNAYTVSRVLHVQMVPFTDRSECLQMGQKISQPMQSVDGALLFFMLVQSAMRSAAELWQTIHHGHGMPCKQYHQMVCCGLQASWQHVVISTNI